MPLSEHEQRILDEIAKQLAEDDPRFAESVRTVTPRSHALRRLRLAAFGLVAGLVIFITGLFIGLENNLLTVVFGFAGFLVMLGSFMIAVKASRSLGTVVATDLRKKRSGQGPKKSMRERLDERWQRRVDGDER
jgi:hypothetical protein